MTSELRLWVSGNPRIAKTLIVRVVNENVDDRPHLVGIQLLTNDRLGHVYRCDLKRFTMTMGGPVVDER